MSLSARERFGTPAALRRATASSSAGGTVGCRLDEERCAFVMVSADRAMTSGLGSRRRRPSRSGAPPTACAATGSRHSRPPRRQPGGGRWAHGNFAPPAGGCSSLGSRVSVSPGWTVESAARRGDAARPATSARCLAGRLACLSSPSDPVPPALSLVRVEHGEGQESVFGGTPVERLGKYLSDLVPQKRGDRKVGIERTGLSGQLLALVGRDASHQPFHRRDRRRRH